MEQKKQSDKAIIKYLSLVVLILIVGLLACKLWYFCSVDLKGRIFDSDSGKALGNDVVISYGDSSVSPDEKGYFTISGYQSRKNSILTVTYGQLYSPLSVEVGQKQFIEIPLHLGSEVFLSKFSHDLKLALFRSNYNVLTDEDKAKLSEDDFLKKANSWYRNITEGGYRLNEVSFAEAGSGAHKSGITGENYGDALKVNFILKLTVNDKVNEYVKSAYFVKRSDGWKWIYNESFWELPF